MGSVQLPGVELGELRDFCRRDTTPACAVRGEEPTERDGKAAPRLFPTLHPQHPITHDLSFLVVTLHSSYLYDAGMV